MLRTWVLEPRSVLYVPFNAAWRTRCGVRSTVEIRTRCAGTARSPARPCTSCWVGSVRGGPLWRCQWTATRTGSCGTAMAAWSIPPRASSRASWTTTRGVGEGSRRPARPSPLPSGPRP